MSESQFHLFRTRRFLPLFLTQALGALNDNLFRNALAFLVIYRIGAVAGVDGPQLVSAAAGLFLLPFFLFSATGGQLADKFDKAVLIKWIKAAEVAIMAGAAIGFFTGSVPWLFVVLFLMGAQSAFFGPVKYSILPDHLRQNEIIGGNALIEAATFLAILIGTIAGGLLILTDGGAATVSAVVVAMALCGFASSIFIPTAPAPAPQLKINPNILAETFGIVRSSAGNRDIFLSILGISWFWVISLILLTQFPVIANEVLLADETVATLFLVVLSVGIGLGSLGCNWLLKGEISAKYVPFAALGMTVFMINLYLATRVGRPPQDTLIDAFAFMAVPGNWRLLVDLLGIAVCGGLFTVPLYSILQTRGDDAHRSRMIAANNILNALFMVVGSGITVGLFELGLSVQEVYLTAAVINGGVAIYICRLLPDALIKAFLISVLKLFYRVDVRGMENLAKAGDKAVIVVNHVSYLDAVLVAAFLPVKPMFAINTEIARQWWMRPFLSLVDAFPIDPTNPFATKTLIKKTRQGRHCVIFPEGRITVTGALMKIHEGPGMIAQKAGAKVVPIRINGAQYTPFSRLRGKVRIRWFPRIRITVLKPRDFDVSKDSDGRERREQAGTMLYDIMSEMVFETYNHRQSLFQDLLDTVAVHGGRQPVLEDMERKPMAFRRLILGAMVLGRHIAGFSSRGECLGILLPNSSATAVTFFGLQAFGRVPAMMNFSTGAKNMLAALEGAEIKTVLTSRRFVEAAKLEETVATLSEKARVVYLEDLRKSIGTVAKLRGLVDRMFARRVHAGFKVGPDDPAVILFTSGSEGTPKGVALSHANLLANMYQLAARIDFNPTDIVFNVLPVFHAFGLTGGLLLPIYFGVKTVQYPSPLHYRIIPALIYDTNATILFGTDTFLNGYARMAHPYDFFSMRYIFAGAEKVKDETHLTFARKFGVRILEGYGATETAPVMTLNTPMHFKAGSVGRLMPGISYTLEPVPGIEDGGRLIVSGPNVMLGYLRAENPGVLEPPPDGRYDTGDIVSIDEEGFVTIKGRAKRFAKIAGEMVSLTAVESHASAVWPDNMHAVISVPDARKGEQLVLVTDKQGAARDALLDYAKANGITELMVPRTVHVAKEVPVLGSGKTDYAGVNALVEGLAPAAEAAEAEDAQETPAEA